LEERKPKKKKRSSARYAGRAWPVNRKGGAAESLPWRNLVVSPNLRKGDADSNIQPIKKKLWGGAV